MIERARQNAARQNAAAAAAAVTFAVAGLGELTALGETFDAVLCLGNSLPHLLTASSVAGMNQALVADRVSRSATARPHLGAAQLGDADRLRRNSHPGKAFLVAPAGFSVDF